MSEHFMIRWPARLYLMALALVIMTACMDDGGTGPALSEDQTSQVKPDTITDTLYKTDTIIVSDTLITIKTDTVIDTTIMIDTLGGAEPDTVIDTIIVKDTIAQVRRDTLTDTLRIIKTDTLRDTVTVADTVVKSVTDTLLQKDTLTIKDSVYIRVQSTLAAIPAGTFQMGSSSGFDNERPIHQVTLTAFHMSKTEVTQSEYEWAFKEFFNNYTNPPWNKAEGLGPSIPAYYVSFWDAALFCNALSKLRGLPDTVYSYDSLSGIPGNDVILHNFQVHYQRNGYRMPTESEWEYAYRAGTTTDHYWGDSANGDYMWYHGNNTGQGASPVGTKKPNAFGLFDMAGNLWEWTGDWYALYTDSAKTDPTGPATGTKREIRGGNWKAEGNGLKAGARIPDPEDYTSYYIGFRYVLHPIE